MHSKKQAYDSVHSPGRVYFDRCYEIPSYHTGVKAVFNYWFNEKNVDDADICVIRHGELGEDYKYVVQKVKLFSSGEEVSDTR